MDALHAHDPSSAVSDPAKYLITAILGIGTIALFALPTVAFSDADGFQVQVGFLDAWDVMTAVGYGWVLYASAFGLLLAVAGALFLTPDSPQPRNLVIGVGALLALVFPLAFLFIQDIPLAFLFSFFFLFSDEGLTIGNKLEMAGSGLFVYTGACILGAFIGFTKSG